MGNSRGGIVRLGGVKFRPTALKFMTERISGIYNRVDSAFRSPNGIPAAFCQLISPKVGEPYLVSWQKRGLDLASAVPSAALAALVVPTLAVRKYVEDGDGAFLVQARLKNETETFPVVKLRTMIKHADHPDSWTIAEGRNHYEDPRSTKFGRFMRKYHLDELPQVFQVVRGEMSTVGNRPILPSYKELLLARWSKGRFISWISNYGKGKKGITGVYQVFGPEKRHDQSRYHMDMFYTSHASLGFDLYILWRTVKRVIGA